MTSYADTGFLVKLYLHEPESQQAGEIMTLLRKPVLLSQLTILELKNAFHLNVFQKKISEATRRAAWNAFEVDLADGLHVVRPIPGSEHYARAGELADTYSAKEGSRSLDLLHVAAALILQADELLSLDTRQRKVALAEGLKVRPELKT
jgi:predicted nucleic acid-binding protein